MPDGTELEDKMEFGEDLPYDVPDDDAEPRPKAPTVVGVVKPIPLPADWEKLPKPKLASILDQWMMQSIRKRLGPLPTCSFRGL